MMLPKGSMCNINRSGLNVESSGTLQLTCVKKTPLHAQIRVYYVKWYEFWMQTETIQIKRSSADDQLAVLQLIF